jgi:hypothetical protein
MEAFEGIACYFLISARWRAQLNPVEGWFTGGETMPVGIDNDARRGITILSK